MSNDFTELMNESAKQKEMLSGGQSPTVSLGEVKVTQMSKRVSKPLSKIVSKHPTQEAIEFLAFELRKVKKERINADVPEDWKQELDDLAHRLGVGKYELVMYVVGQFLGRV
jgi:hypothetical protein